MELTFVILGLVGLMAVIGGFVGFFSMFSAGSKDDRLRQIESHIKQLSAQLDALKKSLEKTSQSPLEAAAPPLRAATLAVATPATSITFTPELGARPSEPVAISDDELTRQALSSEVSATENTRANASVEASAATVANMPASASTPKLASTPAPRKFVPAEPNFIEKGISAAKNWLLGGNTLVRSGIVILFIGIAFLLKLAADKNIIPIELRLMAVALGGIALLVIDRKSVV